MWDGRLAAREIAEAPGFGRWGCRPRGLYRLGVLGAGRETGDVLVEDVLEQVWGPVQVRVGDE